MHPLLSFNLHHDQDVVTARRHAAQIASLLDFDVPDQTRVATAVSEIARNAFRYAGGGWVEFGVELVVVAREREAQRARFHSEKL